MKKRDPAPKVALAIGIIITAVLIMRAGYDLGFRDGKKHMRKWVDNYLEGVDNK